jgi:hypothetical protein
MVYLTPEARTLLLVALALRFQKLRREPHVVWISYLLGGLLQLAQQLRQI